MRRTGYEEGTANSPKGEVDGASGMVGKEIKMEKKHTLKKEFVPPDGGYGWVIVLACGLANFCLLPLIQNFGIIYKEIMVEWKMTAAEYSFLLNFQFSVSNFVGLISGALLRKYGFRVVALCGCILVDVSAVITSYVSSFYTFVFTYSILGGLGIGLSWSASALAINTYFKKKRGIATGCSWTATGLSPVIVPFFVTWLMDNFDVHGTVLILSGMMLHNIPAFMMLHPVQWHTKSIQVEMTVTEENGPNKVPSGEMTLLMEEDKNKSSSHTLEVGARSPIPRHRLSEESSDFLVDTQGTIGLEVAGPVSRHSSRWSLASTGEVSRMTNFSLDRLAAGHKEDVFSNSLLDKQEQKMAEDQDKDEPEKKSCFRRIISNIVEFFDLTLLQDPRFLMIFIGLSLAFGGEMNFTLLTPFVLADKGFPMSQVAVFMSILAAVDLVTRFTFPFISDRFKLDSRLMYSVGITILVTGRIMLAHLNGFYTILFISLWCGLGKGFRTVYMALVLPSNVPLERLPSASGLHMVANGILFILTGPIFGYIRDNSENFTLALYAINIMSFTAILVWTVEVIYSRIRKRRDKKREEKELNDLS